MDDVANDDSDDASDRITEEEGEEERREGEQPRPTRKRGINRTSNIDGGSLLLLFLLSTSPRTIEGNTKYVNWCNSMIRIVDRRW